MGDVPRKPAAASKRTAPAARPGAGGAGTAGPARSQRGGAPVADEADSPPQSPVPVSGRALAAAASAGGGADRADDDGTGQAEPETPSQLIRASKRAMAAKRQGGATASGSARRARAGGAAGAAADDGSSSGEAERPGRGQKEFNQKEFKKGLPLGVKIAGITALLVALPLVGLGQFLLSITTDAVERQINQKGVVAVSELASFADPIFWFEPTQYANERDDMLQKRWAQERKKRLFEWREKLEKLVTDKTNDIFLNVIISSDSAGGGEQLLLASETGVSASVASVRIGEAGEVVIYRGQHAGADFTGEVRRFTRPVYAMRPPPFDENDPLIEPAQLKEVETWKATAKPQHVAFVHAVLKADEIAHVKAAMFRQIAIVTGAGLGVAVVLSIGVAAFLASPLRQLVKDMQIVAEGDLNHKTLPRSRDEIGQVAAQFNEMTRSLKAAQKAEQERQAIEHELAIATEIQTKLLPDRIPQIPGYDLYSFYLSAKEVGGDYYDFLVVDPTHLGVIVADVSGKGIPGSMVMTMVRSLIRLASHRETSPAETLKKVNRILAKDIRRGMFVTAIYAVLDVQRRRLTVSSAGHNPMVYYSAKTGEVRQVNPSGIALGFDKGRTFDENIKEEAIDLSPGDRIALYTDGVPEAMNERSEEFGMERFVEIFKANATASSKDFTNAVVQALEKHRGRSEQSDDITITTLKVE